MAKTPYYQRLETFGDTYYKVLRHVKQYNHLRVEFGSARELGRERLRLYRFMSSLKHFTPEDPLSSFVGQIGIYFNKQTLVLEVVDRGSAMWRSSVWRKSIQDSVAGKEVALPVDEELQRAKEVDNFIESFRKEQEALNEQAGKGKN